MDKQTFIKHYGGQVAAQMKAGKSLEQAYSNVVGQAMAETLIDGLIEVGQGRSGE